MLLFCYILDLNLKDISRIDTSFQFINELIIFCYLKLVSYTIIEIDKTFSK